MDFNAETIMDALDEFLRRPEEVPPILDEYLMKVAKTGNIIFPWCKLKPLLKRKLELVLSEFCESSPPATLASSLNDNSFNFEVLKSHIMEALDLFSSAPFTIQRLCELVTNPKKHYNRTDKYMRGLHKNVLVVTTVDSVNLNEMNNNRNEAMVNGVSSAPNSPPIEEIIYNNENFAPNNASLLPKIALNGTVLDNFASVFPSAPCITSSSNVINVTDSQAFKNTDEENFGANHVSDTSNIVTCELGAQDEADLGDSPMEICPASSDDVNDCSESSDEALSINVPEVESSSMCTEVPEKAQEATCETQSENEQIVPIVLDVTHDSPIDGNSLSHVITEVSDSESKEQETNKFDNVDASDQVTSSQDEINVAITENRQIPHDEDLQIDANESSRQSPDSASAENQENCNAADPDEQCIEMDVECSSTDELSMSNSKNNETCS